MRINNFVKRKLRTNKGETLTETLTSLLIIVPAMVMLAGAIVTAANINRSAKNAEDSKMPKYTAPYEKVEGDKITGTGNYFDYADINWYKEKGSTYYYFR